MAELTGVGSLSLEEEVGGHHDCEGVMWIID